MNNGNYDILIVEDDPNDADLTVRTLEKNRLANSYLILEDGEEALNYMFAEGEYAGRDPLIQPKVIFLDLKLPKVHGLEVLARVKSCEHTKKIPVIVITSSKEDPDIKTAYELGANSYVVKPVDFNDFMERVGHLGYYWMVVNEKYK